MLDLLCIGYISYADIFEVDDYPNPNTAVQIKSISPSMGADAPIVASIASSLGLSCGFVGNDLGRDPHGKSVFSLIKSKGVKTTAKIKSQIVTPSMIVVCDRNEARTVFSYMPNVAGQITQIDLKTLPETRLAYIDFYTELSSGASRVIRHLEKKKIPVYVNLSGDNIDNKLTLIESFRNVVAVQVSLEGQRLSAAKSLLRKIANKTKAELAIVTMGVSGAVAMLQGQIIHAPAYTKKAINITHGAGAAFSSGYIFGLLNNWTLQKSLTFATTIASINCSTKDGVLQTSPNAILKLIGKIDAG